MIRGTTPTIEFILPFDAARLAAAYITFSQKGEKKLEKGLADCALDGSRLILHLSQEDTLSLESDWQTEMQIRARDQQGGAFASKIMVVATDRILKDGVI